MYDLYDQSKVGSVGPACACTYHARVDELSEVILWGGAGQARVLNECLLGSGYKVLAVFDNRTVPPSFPDIPFDVGKDGFRAWMTIAAAEMFHTLQSRLVGRIGPDFTTGWWGKGCDR
jgi:hypothetical protein